MKVFIGLIIPFLGTMLGSSMVFLMKDKLNQKLGNILSGFAVDFILMMILDVALW